MVSGKWLVVSSDAPAGETPASPVSSSRSHCSWAVPMVPSAESRQMKRSRIVLSGSMV